jgi:hypothetical protein
VEFFADDQARATKGGNASAVRGRPAVSRLPPCLSDKKQFERFLLEQCLRVSTISAEVVEDKGEAPDFVIRTGAHLIDVELTELFQAPGSDGSAKQAQEELARRIAKRAKEIYRQRGALPAHVSIQFSSSSDLRLLNREQTAGALADFIESQFLAPWQRREWRHDCASTTLPSAISYLNMLGVPEAGMAHWSTPQAGWVTPQTLETIQQRVDEKAKRLPKYKDRVPTNWLLLVSDGARPSQFFEPPSSEVANAVVSPFDRTFYFARFKEVAVELGVGRDDA